MLRSLAGAKLLILVTAVALAGCGKKEAGKNGHDHHHHDHGGEGPHGGHIAELEGSDLHIEWVHEDEEDLLTIYVLDKDAKKLAPVEAKELQVVVTVAGETEKSPLVFKLPAVEPQGDPPKASKFEIKSDELLVHLEIEENDIQLKGDFGGQAISAKLEHDHDHDH